MQDNIKLFIGINGAFLHILTKKDLIKQYRSKIQKMCYV